MISLVIVRVSTSGGEVCEEGRKCSRSRQVYAVDYATATTAVCSRTTAVWGVRPVCGRAVFEVRLKGVVRALRCLRDCGKSRRAGCSGGLRSVA